MTVAMLVAELTALQGTPPAKGLRKPQLVAALTAAKAATAKAAGKTDDAPLPATPPPLPQPPMQQQAAAMTGRRRRAASAATSVKLEEQLPPVQPGTSHLGAAPASARSAAREKRRAGENRAVEHVALHDEAELAEIHGVAADEGAAPSKGTKSKAVAGKRRKVASGKREWAAEVAVPNSAGLDEVLAREE